MIIEVQQQPLLVEGAETKDDLFLAKVKRARFVKFKEISGCQEGYGVIIDIWEKTEKYQYD